MFSLSSSLGRGWRLACLLLWSVAAGAGAATHATSAAPRLNVVLILADDLGWSDTTLYGTTKLYRTPNLDRLAARGMTFTCAHSASPLCSPTRASILTGQTPARTGSTSPSHHEAREVLSAQVRDKAPPGDKALETVSVTRLATNFPTLGRLLRDAGYRTAHFGKWHLGPEPYSPLQHGFEVDLPHTSGPGPAGGFVAPWRYGDFVPNTPHEHIEDRMASEAVRWMERVKDEPFYLQYWAFSVHAPFDAKEELVERYRGAVDRRDPQHSPTYAAMVQSLDDAVGTLLDALDRLGIADRTVVVFTSDNGGNMYNGIRETAKDGGEFVTTPTSNTPLRGGKATVYEGGIRVPQVVVWPGLAKPGSRTDALSQSTDLYPTLLSAAGVTVPAGHVVDGVDLRPALAGKPFERGPIFTYFPHSPEVPDWLPPSVAVQDGDWKLIRLFHQGEAGAHAYRLYHLGSDLGETNDLSTAQADRVRSMDRLIEQHLVDARAVVPRPNPAFDPAAYRPEKIGVQAGGPKVVEKRGAAKPAAKPSGKKNAAAPAGAGSAGEWQAGRDTVQLRSADGELVIAWTAGDPWIQTDLNPPLAEAGGVVVEFDILSPVAGPVRLHQRNREGRGFDPADRQDGRVTQSGEWTTVAVKLPDRGAIHGLRISPPSGAAAGEARLRNVRVRSESGETLKAWFAPGS